MSEHPINRPNVIWPVDAVYNANGIFVGFTMKEATGMDLKKLMSQREKRDGSLLEGFGIFNLTKTQIVGMFISILETMVFFHERNIIIGDIKLDNFMIMNNDPRTVYFVDCDSYQVGEYPATKVSPGYTPPETQGMEVDKVYRTFGNEYYAIFALLFRILFKDISPYAQVPSNDLAALELDEIQKAAAGLFPYSTDKERTEKHHPPKGYHKVNWSHLPSYVKDAFLSVGHCKGSRFDKNNRLTAEEWLAVFKAYERDLKSGRLRKNDPDCDVGIHGAFAIPIDYNLVKIVMEEIIKHEVVAVNLSDAVRKFLEKSNKKLSEKEINQIAMALRTSPQYALGSFAFDLKRNAGVVCRVECTYQGG